METKRRNRLVPEGTARAILLENVVSDTVLVPNKEGKKELVFYRVEEKELSDCVYDYLLDEDVARQKRLQHVDKSNVADECKYFEPLIPGKRKYYSCDYCKTSRDCMRYVRAKKNERKN